MDPQRDPRLATGREEPSLIGTREAPAAGDDLRRQRDRMASGRWEGPRRQPDLSRPLALGSSLPGSGLGLQLHGDELLDPHLRLDPSRRAAPGGDAARVARWADRARAHAPGLAPRLRLPRVSVVGLDRALRTKHARSRTRLGRVLLRATDVPQRAPALQLHSRQRVRAYGVRQHWVTYLYQGSSRGCSGTILAGRLCSAGGELAAFERPPVRPLPRHRSCRAPRDPSLFLVTTRPPAAA